MFILLFISLLFWHIVIVDFLASLLVMQALKSRAFNNFTAIYHLLLERWQKCTRLFSMHAEHRLAEDHRRPSTVADQALIRFALSHAPCLGDTRSGPFSRTTDGVTPVDFNAPHRATQQQRIYTSGPQPEMGFPSSVLPRLPLAKMSIDEGVELEDSESSYEMQAASASTAANTNLVSFSSDGSSDVASFDSSTDADILAGVVQATPWAFTSGESASSATGLVSTSAGEVNQDFVTDKSANLPESLSGMGAEENVAARCRLAVPGPSNTLQVPVVSGQGGSQDGFFHSGRRASDGLATRTDILQLQQLMKTRGVPELQKELDSLQVPADLRQPPRSRRAEHRHGRPQQQHSFEEGSYATGGRLSPFSARKLRQGNCVRPRLAALGRSRQPVPTKSPLAELNTLCRMLPTGGTVERNRSPLSSEHQMMQQQFQQLGIDGTSASTIPLPSSSGLIQVPVAIGPTAVIACLSDQRLSVPSPPTTTSDVSACHSQDSIHSYIMKQSIAPVHLPVGQTVTVVDDGSTGSVRRHMVRRTLYRLVHQQTLISSFGEEDIPEVSPVSEQAAGSGDGRPESQRSNNMDVT